ncbi:hypothetical protein ACIBG6_39120 [Streptomyces sp. NPDC050842]|uniref:hypothetical protein n=1 Tax=Streptomyces sp. NPDC050842 TaxID=3365636 RepID=UPI0037B6443E
METLRKYFEDHPEVFAALVAALSIIGGLAGSVIGAKIQANGGRAQANAAREAAQITAEAQHLLAMHQDLKVEVASFVREARETLRLALSMLQRNLGTNDQEAMRAAEWSMRRKLPELELIAPPSVVVPAKEALKAVLRVTRLARQRSNAVQVYRKLEDPGQFQERAREAYGQYCLAARSVNPVFRRDLGEEGLRLREAAESALRNIPSLSPEEITALLQDAENPPLSPERHEAQHTAEGRLRDVVEAARAVLAPTLPAFAPPPPVRPVLMGTWD